MVLYPQPAVNIASRVRVEATADERFITGLRAEVDPRTPPPCHGVHVLLELRCGTPPAALATTLDWRRQPRGRYPDQRRGLGRERRGRGGHRPACEGQQRAQQ